MAEQIDDDNTVQGAEDNSELLKISELTVQSQTILISLYNLRGNIKNIETNFRNYERIHQIYSPTAEKSEVPGNSKEGGR